jgi:hypothetical protein
MLILDGEKRIYRQDAKGAKGRGGEGERLLIVDLEFRI